MKPINVLLVDDEADFLETLAKRLTRRQMAVLTAGSGAAALGILATTDIDVVVLDVKMPGQDGIQVLKQIKKEKPLVEVILLTGHASVEAAISGMAMGAFDYLMKPMDIDDIVYKLQDAFKNKALQEEKIRSAQAHDAPRPHR
ncbi:MAG: response regulator [Pseudomonadota bacterium]